MRRVQILAHRTLSKVGSFLRLDLFDVEYPALATGFQKNVLVNLHRGDTVAVLLHIVGKIKAKPNQCLVLCEQFRLPTILNAETGLPDKHTLKEKGEYAGYQIELLTGMRLAGEPLSDSASREVFEELGLKPKLLKYVTSYYPSPGACSEQLHLYYAQVEWPETRPWPSTERRKEESSLASTENIRLLFVSPSEFLEMIETGELVDGKCFVAAEWMRRAENTQRFFEEN